MSFVVIGILLLLLIGTPVAAAFALMVFLNATRLNIWLDSLSSVPYQNLSNYALVAIPLFILVGGIMNRGGIASSLATMADRVIGRVRASFGYIMIISSAFLGAITGSSVATVAAMGSTLGPEMVVRGYPRGYIGALNAATGLLGVLIPPSIPLIVYGATVGVSITELFIATLLPGLLMVVAFCVTHLFRSRKVLAYGREYVEAQEPSATQQVSASASRNKGVASLILPVIILGGIYGGIFTPTEAAAVACIYAGTVTLLLRTLNFGGLLATVYGAVVPAAAIMLIIAMTGILNRALILNQVPQDLAVLTTGLFASPILFLVSVNVLLFVVGMFMETNAAVILMAPLLAPSAAAFHINPIHFAIIVVTNIEIGLITPPLAVNLYVAARTNEVNIVEMLRHFGWFLVAAIIVLVLITYIPVLSLWYQFL